jgi:hypothetical protein
MMIYIDVTITALHEQYIQGLTDKIKRLLENPTIENIEKANRLVVSHFKETAFFVDIGYCAFGAEDGRGHFIVAGQYVRIEDMDEALPQPPRDTLIPQYSVAHPTEHYLTEPCPLCQAKQSENDRGCERTPGDGFL